MEVGGGGLEESLIALTSDDNGTADHDGARNPQTMERVA